MKQKVVIFVGVLTEYQGVDILLEAVPLVGGEVPEVKFLIVGYPNEAVYRQKAHALGVDKWTQFTGRVSYEDVPRYLALADIAVSPKISTTEANLKLFAYMAMGLPTVAFDSPINREILGDVGVYAQWGDTRALADALIKALKDEQWAQELGARSRRKAAREYSWLRVGQRLRDIYELIGSNQEPQLTGKGRTDGQLQNISHRRSRLYRLAFNKRAP